MPGDQPSLLNPIDLQPIVDATVEVLAKAQLATGQYARWVNEARITRQSEPLLNPYGCAGAANILYSIGAFPRGLDERELWITTLQNMQDPETGLFYEVATPNFTSIFADLNAWKAFSEAGVHHPYHVTAHCIAALQLFDARPLYKIRSLDFLAPEGALEDFLNNLPWAAQPWNASHQCAGVFAARVISGEASADWQERYFAWLEDELDEKTGFWKRGCIDHSKPESFFPYLAGTFHYLFNYEHSRRPFRYPQALIDSCLAIYQENLWSSLGKSMGFSEIDWVYCLNRAVRQSGYRFDEVQSTLKEFSLEYTGFLLQRIKGSSGFCDDVHALLGVISALAELQVALPGFLKTRTPLCLVLDRRPFI